MNAALHTGADAVARLAAARPMVVDVVPASEVSAHHAAGGVSHAGPPIEPARMCAPMRAALGSALWLEGVAGSPAEALMLVDDGQIPLSTNHDAGGVGPMAGVVNPSMPVWVARDEATGKVAWCPLNEGSGAVLRYGADGPEVLERLRWMSEVLAPELRAALSARSTCTTCTCRSLALGDEAHHRTERGTELTLAALGDRAPRGARVHPFNGQFFLNLAMVFSKLALDCAADVPGSPVLTAIARNGVEVGIRVSGTGDQWFVGPAALPDPAKLFDGYAPADMNPDLGDSAIVEMYGLGALAVAASPRPRAPSGSTRRTRRDRRPAAGDRRRRVARDPLPGRTRRRSSAWTRARSRRPDPPPVHTGIAHLRPGVGQIGGGVTHPPLEAFDLAVEALG